MTRVDRARWLRVRAIVEEALTLRSDERARHVAEHCGDDAALRADVHALLAADDALETDPSITFLAGTADVHVAELIDAGDDVSGAVDAMYGARRATPMPETIGRYTVRRLIAEGGMGAVYEAEQSDPKRLVAVKVLRGGAHVDDDHLRLFRREVDSLARLRHPGVAAIHEAGRTIDGEHYFVMELVDGVPLDEYVRSLGAITPSSIRARLALFLDLCDAVGYAHQRGVIHRDLKPANILVVRNDGDAPRIKVLDFGIARITDDDAALVTKRTHVGVLLGTLAYMSPEQARGDADAVDVRSDVYALGVVLYEMLTGTLPCDVRGVPLPQAVRTICDDAPRRPSTHVRSLAGDLETIVLKSLEKEPARRYASVTEFADDLRRFANGLPIHARPATALYQLRKLSARHKGAAILTCALAAALVLGIAGTSTGWIHARREAARARAEAATAERVTTLVEGVFKVSDPSEARGSTVTAREVLDASAARVRDDLRDEPAIRGRLLRTMGNVYRNLGLYKEARPLLEDALAAQRAAHGDAHLDVASSHAALATLLRRLGDFPAARTHYERALAIREDILGPADTIVAGSVMNLGNLLQETGDLSGARTLYARAIDIHRRARHTHSSDYATTLFNYGLLLSNMHDDTTAVPVFEECVALEKQLGSATYAEDLAFLAFIRGRTGDYARALTEQREALALQERTYGSDHPSVGETLGNMCVTARLAGHLARSREYGERALAIFAKHVGHDHPTTAKIKDNLATTLRESGDPHGALRLTRDALRVLERSPDAEGSDLGSALSNCGQTYAAISDWSRAEEYLQRAVTTLTRATGPKESATNDALRALGRVYVASGRPREAHVAYAQVVRHLDDGGRLTAGQSASFFADYAALLRAQGKADSAIAVAARGRVASRSSARH